MDTLTVSHVKKSFDSQEIIRDLSFRVPEHSVFGFIGENGAGKTTTMKMILGLLRMDGGEILVEGEAVCYGQTRTNRYVGYLPDVPEYYGFMTPREYLRLCAEVSGITRIEADKRADELLEMVGLTKADKRIHGFSRGMKQRLGIAQALLGKPKLLICDEPTSALDPLGRKEILDILSAVRESTTVLFSTHILSDVERICDQIALLHHGEIALQGTMDDIHAMHKGAGFEIEFHRKEDLLQLLGESRYITGNQRQALWQAAGELELDADRICSETELSGLMEGLYIKVEEQGQVTGRLKYVRAAFLQCVDFSENHWIDKLDLSEPLESREHDGERISLERMRSLRNQGKAAAS